MTIKKEISLREFEFWGPAAQVAEQIGPEGLDIAEQMIEDLGLSELDETALNDMFAYDDNFLRMLVWAGLLPNENEDEDEEFDY